MYYQLSSGEALHAAHPESFEIPERAERETVPVGGLVKLVFCFDDGTERMWVKVVKRYPDGNCMGTLDSEPLCKQLKRGTLVSFRPEHITKIYGRLA